MHGVNAQSTKENRGNQNASSLAVIQISDLHLQKEDDLSLLKQCIEQYNVLPKSTSNRLPKESVSLHLGKKREKITKTSHNRSPTFNLFHWVSTMFPNT
jgi:hypothetical protein